MAATATLTVALLTPTTAWAVPESVDAPPPSVEEVSRFNTGMGVESWTGGVVSADGTAAAFEAWRQTTGPQLYERLLGSHRTVQVSTTSSGDPADGGKLTFGPLLTANGSTVFFGWDGASNLTPEGSKETFSKVFVKDLTTRRLTSLAVPPVLTSGGMRRPVIGSVAVSRGGRLPPVAAASRNRDVFEVVRYDREVGQWSTLCSASTPTCGLDLTSPDGRYVVIDNQIHDLAAGTVAPVPVEHGTGSNEPCQFSGDSRVLVCLVRDRLHHVDTAHLTWYSMPSVTQTRKATVMRYAVLRGVDRDGSHLALSLDRYQPAHGMFHPQAYSYDSSTGASTMVAVFPDGTPSVADSIPQGMTDTGEVLFISRDRTLDTPSRGTGFHVFLATVSP